jgi:hypothetical protein
MFTPLTLLKILCQGLSAAFFLDNILWTIAGVCGSFLPQFKSIMPGKDAKK